ncbi:MAG: hypothetical protein D6755_12665 [Anaerolineae bacterium]|nr:MAG: hypothetical protein D6755_12665 [Anaerolineae bacterium]
MSETRSYSLRRIVRGFFRWFNVLLLPLVLMTAAYVAARDDTRTYLHNLHLRWGALLLSFCIAAAGLLLAVWVWQQMLSALGGSKHTFGEHVRVYCYSALGDLLPGGVWKIVSRSTLYDSRGDNLTIAATASLTETLVVGTASMGLYALGTLLSPRLDILAKPLWGILATLITLMLIHPRVLGTLVMYLQRRQGKDTAKVQYTLPNLLAWMVLEMGVVAIGGGALFTLLNSLTSASLELLLPLITAWAAASAAGNLFFWMPGSPILRDGALLLILTNHIPTSIALGFVVLVRLWSLGSLLLLAGIAWISAKIQESSPF